MDDDIDIINFYIYLSKNRASPGEICKKIQFDGKIVKIFLKKVPLFQDFMISVGRI